MARVLVLGHGGYAVGIQDNLAMLVGELNHMDFLDLTRTDDMASFEAKIQRYLQVYPEDDILFACDLLGATPFRIAAVIALQSPLQYVCVCGLNTMAYLELALDHSLPLDDLANRALETTKKSVDRFPKLETQS